MRIVKDALTTLGHITAVLVCSVILGYGVLALAMAPFIAMAMIFGK